MNATLVLFLAFTLLPFVAGLVLPVPFRVLIALGVAAAIIEAFLSYRNITGNEGDWTPGLEAALFTAVISLLFLGLWIASASLGRGARTLGRYFVKPS